MKIQSEMLASIATIKASQATLNELIQEVAIGCIGHAMMYGDVTLGDRLLDATKGSDRKALVQYLKEFGPFKVDAETGTFKLNRKFREEHEFDEVALTDGVKWYSFAPDTKKVMASFDVGKRIVSVIKTAQAKAAEGAEVDNLDLIEYVSAAIKKYNGDVAEAKRNLFAGSTPMQQAA